VRLQVEAQPSGDGLQVTVTGPDLAGGTLQVGVIRPDLQSSTQELVAVAPGRWQGRISAPAVGAYLLHAALLKGGQTLAQADSAVSVSYSPEYLELGRDDALLSQVAKAGAGVILARPALAWNQRPLPIPISSDLFWLLVLLAALVWPLDVAVRRITLGPRQLLANALTFARERRAAELEIAVPEELARLRRRVAATRRPRVGVEAPPSVLSSEAEAGAGSRRLPKEREPELEAEAEARRRKEEAALSARLLEARRRRRGQGD
jgi:hypothetical protein